MRNMFLVILMLVAFSESMAAVFLVEKDGTGDFQFLQDAADAAASGDTIRVGPGRFHQWAVYYEIPGTLQYTTPMLIDSKDLLVIGQPDGSTIVGPAEPWSGGTPSHHGLVVMSASRLEIRNVVFTNLSGAVLGWGQGETIVSGCHFLDNDISLFGDGGSCLARDCDFLGGVPGGMQVFSHFQVSCTLRDCRFEQDPGQPERAKSVNISGAQTASVEDCQFINSFTAYQSDRGTRSTVRRCTFRNNSYAIEAHMGAETEVLDCLLDNPLIGIMAYHEPYSLQVERTVVEDAGTATMVVNHLVTGHVRDCLLSKGDRGVVLYYPHLFNPNGQNGTGHLDHGKDLVSPVSGNPIASRQAQAGVFPNLAKSMRASNQGAVDFDMTDNYWGTTDPDSIQAWIDDHLDDSAAPYRIIWDPYKDQPVSQPNTSLGSFKGLFR